MPLNDPISAYNAKNNVEALLVQQYLESGGVEAFFAEDNGATGFLPEIHKPQVWISRADADRAAKLLAQYEQDAADRDATRPRDELESIDALCEECGKTSSFPGSLQGTVQNCPHCLAYIDVGEFDWPDDPSTDAGEDA